MGARHVTTSLQPTASSLQSKTWWRRESEFPEDNSDNEKAGTGCHQEEVILGQRVQVAKTGSYSGKDRYHCERERAGCRRGKSHGSTVIRRTCGRRLVAGCWMLRPTL